MPALQSQFAYLVASGAHTAIAADLASLPPAVQAEVTLADVVAYARIALARTSLLGFRPSQGPLVDLLSAMQLDRSDLGLGAYPAWDFSDPSSWGGMPGWETTADGPSRPTPLATDPISLENSNTRYVNVGCHPVTSTRGDQPLSNVQIGLWQAMGGDLQFIKDGTLDSGGSVRFQHGPFPPDVPVALTLIARDQDGRLSYPTAFLVATPHT